MSRHNITSKEVKKVFITVVLVYTNITVMPAKATGIAYNSGSIVCYVLPVESAVVSHIVIFLVVLIPGPFSGRF